MDDRIRTRYEEIKARMKTSVTITGFRNSLIANWINGRRRSVLTHLDRAGFLPLHQCAGIQSVRWHCPRRIRPLAHQPDRDPLLHHRRFRPAN